LIVIGQDGSIVADGALTRQAVWWLTWQLT
jgi:hypothetical protein